MDNTFNFVGILLALVSIILDCISVSTDKSPDIGLSIVMLILAMISLLINIVDYKTGDCLILRKAMMIIACLWWCDLCECCRPCYNKTSKKLLMLFNFILWFILFLHDVNQYTTSDGNEEEDGLDAEQILFIAEESLAVQLKFFKAAAATIGMGGAFISFLFRLMAKICEFICKLICCLICIVMVLAIVITVVVVYIGATSDDDGA